MIDNSLYKTYEPDNGFGFRFGYVPVHQMMPIWRNRIDELLTSTKEGTSQPASMHGRQTKVMGYYDNDIKDGVMIAKATELHQMEGMTEATKRMIRFVRSIIPDAYTPKYAFWTVRDAMTAFDQLRAGRFLKFVELFLPKHYNMIKNMHDTIGMKVEPGNKLYRSTLIKKCKEVATWTLDDFIYKTPRRIQDKTAGPAFSRMLGRSLSITKDMVKLVNTGIYARHDGSKLFEEDHKRWTWEFFFEYLRSDRVSIYDREALASLVAGWYRRLSDDLVQYYELESEAATAEYPRDYRDWEVPVLIPHQLHGVTMGLRDCCDVDKIQMNLSTGQLQTQVSESSQRIVVRGIDAAVSIANLEDFVTILNSQTNNKYAGSVIGMQNATKADGGIDVSNCDTLTGRVMNEPVYNKAPRVALSISKNSGDTTTQVKDSRLVYEIWSIAGLLEYLVYVMGDDQGTTIFPVDKLISYLLDFWKASYEMLKGKQCSWVSQDTGRWINFILGKFVMPSKKANDRPYATAIKTLATKQSPLGSEHPLWDRSGWEYTEIRKAPNFDEIYSGKPEIWFGTDISDYRKAITKDNVNWLLDRDEAPGSWANVVV